MAPVSQAGLAGKDRRVVSVWRLLEVDLDLLCHVLPAVYTLLIKASTSIKLINTVKFIASTLGLLSEYTWLV